MRCVLTNMLAGLCAVAAVVPALAASPDGGVSIYHNTRYLDDFSYLGDPARAGDPLRPADFWDGVKYIRLGDDPYGMGAPYLSFGGELRERFEAYTNPNFGIKAPAHNDYLLQRLLLHADLVANAYLRGFLQLGSMQRLGARGIPSTTDINQLDIMQGFVDIRVPTPLGDAPSLRSGRQEVLLGFQRLVAVREGPNVRRSFDGFRLSDQWGGATIDLLALRPVTNKSGAFNDSTNLRQALWGAYATVPILPGLAADLYWLGYDNARATFRGRIGGEQRQSFGTRVFGAMAGWDWNEEAVLQVGSFSGRDIRAWMVASIVGYTFTDVAWRPRLALEGNASSGDNPRSGTIGTYNGLYPRLPYFAETAMLVPSNLYDVRPVVSFRPLADVVVVAGWDTLWRTSTRDALYGSGMVPYPRTAKAASARVGAETSLDIRWRPDPHLTFGAIYAHMAAGPAITAAGGGDVNYAVLFASYRF
jgi:hypothetical protein